MKTHTVLAIGAHVGDAELTAGALLATCAVHGGKAVTLALTAGEKGAPAGADIAAYRRDKIAQAEAFAKDLGGEAIVLPYEDGLVPDNDEIRFAVCDVIRQVKPDIIVTHHANSMHKDNAACHRIVVDAWFYAAIEGFQRELQNILPKSSISPKTGRTPPDLSPMSIWMSAMAILSGRKPSTTTGSRCIPPVFPIRNTMPT